jgi:uncharacterized membrane protein YhaH (DUF805 family)
MEKEESSYNMLDWWKKVVFKNYSNFRGRARRAEYWYFVLANFLIVIPIYVIGIIAVTTENIGLSTLTFTFYGLFLLATIVPGLAVIVRRLHDLNRSGWSYFIGFIPLIGAIILLVWFFTEGDRFPNNYGGDPKNIPDVAFDFERNDMAS